MIYESKALPKTPLGVLSVPRLLAEVPPVDHAAIVEQFRKALCVDPWDDTQKVLGDKLEQLAVNLDANSGDLSKVPLALAQEINDLATELPWRFHARDRFFEIRGRLSEILHAQRH
jgi:hypothetical protein